MANSKSIILIHGNFVNDISWLKWKERYEQRGYNVYTPANPGHDGTPSDLRKNVHPALTKTGFIDVVNNIKQLIDSLPEKPLIIGHSMAGMAAMKLLELDKAAAAVSIDGAPPKNVFPPFTTLKAVLPAFGFFLQQNILWEVATGTTNVFLIHCLKEIELKLLMILQCRKVTKLVVNWY